MIKSGACISTACAVMWCLSVMFMYCFETNKRILKLFHRWIATHSSFPCQTLWQYSDGEPPSNLSATAELLVGRGRVWNTKLLIGF